jgi:hypothetical protein
MDVETSLDIVSVSDACAVLDYLHRREILCQICGDKLAVWENPVRRCCDECKPVHGEYNRAKVTSVIEKRIVSALQRWLAKNTPDAQPGDG